MRASRKAELDESKFASVTAGMVVRKAKPVPSVSPLQDSWNGLEHDVVSGDFLVGKGEAGPSVMERLAAAAAQFESGAASDPQDRDEKRRLSEELGRLQAALAERETWLADARSKGEQARESWAQETEDLLRKAEQNFKDQAERWMADEAQQQEQLANALAAVTARCEQAEALVVQAHAKANAIASAAAAGETELRRLREEYGSLRTALTQREAALAQMRSAHDKAEQAGTADGATRLTAAQAQWQSETAHILADARAQAQAALGQSEEECRRLRDEAVSLQAVLSDRENALAKMRAENERAQEQWQKDSGDALRKAGDAWKSEEAKRSAASAAQWQQRLADAVAAETTRREKAEALLAQTKARADDVARDAQHHDNELKRLREEFPALQTTLVERDAALAELRLAGEQAREAWARESRESKDALQKAEQAWKAAEATRFAAAEAYWQDRSARALAGARAQADAARQTAESDLGRLRQELTALQAALSENAKELAQTRLLAETQPGEAQDALRKAEQAWKAGEAARLAAAEAAWREKSSQEVTEARAQANAARQTAENKVGRLRQELSALQAALTENAKELAQTRLLAETQPGEAQDALRKAEQAWKAGEAARLAAAEAAWSEKTAEELTEARAQADAARHTAEKELDRLRQELTALHRALSENANELAQMHALAGKAQETQPGETHEMLRKAEQSWKAGEAARLAEAEAQWRKQSAVTLAEAKERYQKSERALAQVRAENARGRSLAIDAGNTETKQDIKSMRLRMGGQAAEPDKVRLSTDVDRAPGKPEARIAARPNGLRDVFKSSDEAPPTPLLRGPLRDVAIAAVLGSFVIVAYPTLAPLLPESWRSMIASVTGGAGQTADSAQDTEAIAAPLPQDAAAKPLAVVLKDVNLRANPSTSDAVVSKLIRGNKVAVIEERGKWTKVRLESQSGKTEPVQGWVLSSFLKADAT